MSNVSKVRNQFFCCMLLCAVVGKSTAQVDVDVQMTALLKQSMWRVENSWFGDSVVTLIPIPQHEWSDTTSFTRTIGDSVYTLYDKMRNLELGEYFYFDADNKFVYSNFFPCLVDAVYTDIKSFVITDSTVTLSCVRFLYEENFPPYKEISYEIIMANTEKIVLQLK